MPEQAFSEFEGRAVVGARITVPGLAGGLRKAAAAQNLGVLEQGDRVYLLLETTVGRVSFTPVLKEGIDTEEDLREHTLVLDVATVVPETFATKQITAQRERIRVMEEREAGIQHLHGTSAADAEDGYYDPETDEA